MRRKEPGRPRFRGSRKIEPEHDVGRCRFAFQLHAPERADGGIRRNDLEDAAAFGLESLLDGGSGPPFGGEGIIGVDGEHLLRGGGRDQSGKQEQDGKRTHA